MTKYAPGKFAKFISDRSGMEFPYKERIQEWNGHIVHISEYEAKHPQLEPKKPPLEPQALYQPRRDRVEPNPVIISETFLGDGIENKSYHAVGAIGEVTVVTS